MSEQVHRRIEGCLLDWVVPQADVDSWESLKKLYAEAGRSSEAHKGDWPGMKAESLASWDPSITLRWDIEGIDTSRDLYPLHLMTVNADGVEMNTRNIGYFASQAEARLFAAALLLTVQQLSPDEVMREAGFTPNKDDTELARWKRRMKSGDLQIRIKPETYINPIHFDRELYLTYNGDKAKRIVRIVFVCPSSNRSSANDPEQTYHPANGILADPFAADILAALTITDARLTLGNIRKPLDDGNEIAFIEQMVAQRDAALNQTTSGMRSG